jgi:hypothetical protein
MPAKHTVKTYIEDGIYHVFNRGNDQRVIFHDDADYRKFISILSDALTSPTEHNPTKETVTTRHGTFEGAKRQPKNFHGSIMLLSYCLMPTHFHLLIQQHTDHALPEFIKSICTRYVMYYNLRYKRTGKLFQTVYKATDIMDDASLLNVSRYIHRNPLTHTKSLLTAWSSYSAYHGYSTLPWIHTELILGLCGPGNIKPGSPYTTYKEFVEWENEELDRLFGEDPLAG